MPIGNVNKEPAPKRETFRPPWVKEKDSEAPPPWLQKKLKPVETATEKKPVPTVEDPPVVKVLKPTLKKQSTIKDKPDNGTAETVEEKLVRPSAAKQADKALRPTDEKPRFTRTSLKPADKNLKSDSLNEKSNQPEKPTLKSLKTINDNPKGKSVTISDKKTDQNGLVKTSYNLNGKKVDEAKDVKKVNDKSRVEEKIEDKSKMATKPPTSLEKSPSKLPPRKPSLVKQASKDDITIKKWRDPLHERVKENIDKTLANEIPKGHTLSKNESLRSLLKPTPPPMPPPLPPKMPPPPEFKKAALAPEKLKKLDQLKSRPRKRPDWSDMMKEVEEGKKLKKVVCNDRSSPIIARTSVVKNKDQFIFESEKPNSHNELLREISKGVKLKKVKCSDRSKPILEGLRKFRRQMTIEEQVQKSMSQANLLASSPSGVSVAEVPGQEEDDIDEMDDIDKVRDDLQSTKQLLQIELRNKEVQERENKRLQTRIQNLEAELARERAIIKQEQHKTVISVTDAYDERLVTNLKIEVEKAKETADNIEKQYLEAAEERDTAQTDLEEMKRKNAELEKKLEQALSNKVEDVYESQEPLSFYQKRQLEYEKECRLLNVDSNPNSEYMNKKKCADANYNLSKTVASTNFLDDLGIVPSNAGSRRSSHAVKQLSINREDSFEMEDVSEEEEEETEEKKQKRIEKEIRNMRNKIRHLKEKQDNMKRERMGYKMSLKNQQAALKEEKKKYKELKREVDKMAAMMKEVGSDEEEDEDEDEEQSEEDKKSESDTEEEETETETEQDTESETESESEPEDAPLPKKKDNLTHRLKRHETRVHALKKGNALVMANVDRMQDDVLNQREKSAALKKELDSLIEDLE